MKKILVTGAKGFIGLACLDVLSLENVCVYATTSHPVKNPIDKNIRWIQIDLLDNQIYRKTIKEIKPTHLLHLAWTARPGKFWTDSENYQWLKSSLDLFEVFFENGGERLVGLGSCAEYQPNHKECKENETPTLPTTLYGMCKLSCGLGALAAGLLYDKSVAWGRLFCPYGPQEHPGRFLPDVIDHVLMKKPIMCGNKDLLRDFIFIKDVAHILTELLSKNIEGVINIGSGIPVSLEDLAQVVITELGHSELIQFGRRPSSAKDPVRLVANVDRLKTELNWTPLYSLETGIKEMIRYRSKMVNEVLN